MDLIYLRKHAEKLKQRLENESYNPILVPTQINALHSAQSIVIPTILGRDVRKYIRPLNQTMIDYPYPSDSNENVLEWELFFLHLGCKPATLHISKKHLFDSVLILPSFTTYSTKACILAEKILPYQSDETLVALQQFPILCSNNIISPVSATHDQTLINDMQLLPSLQIPS
ncbi:unnamed protein product, partial [Didymodactylos carnosus]